MEEGKTIQVLVADDHQIVRQGLRLIFETTPSIDLVGEATNGQEAVDLAAELRPDVILMDMKMPVMDGIQAIRRIGATQPEMAVIILTTFEDDEMMLAGLQVGAKAFLLKDTRRQALVRTIQAAARGESLLSPEIMARLLAHTGKTETTPDTTQASAVHQVEHGLLSPREMEVLGLVTQGLPSKEIARRLAVSERTVKAHLTHIYNKLGVDSRAGAVAEAARRGLLS